jgi:hypothetical protein
MAEPGVLAFGIGARVGFALFNSLVKREVTAKRDEI